MRLFFTSLSCFILTASMMPVGVHGFHEGHHSHAGRHHTPSSKSRGGSGLINDKQLLHDKDHLQEDLSDTMSKEDIESMTDEELEYQYFRTHDFDNNHKLDGLELLAAVGHVIQIGGENDGLDLQYLDDVQEMIDDVLSSSDLNMDGYLSYIEYSISRKSG